MEQGFKVLYPFVACQELAFCDPRLLLERRVLVNELNGRYSATRVSTRPIRIVISEPRKVTTHLLLDDGELLQIAFQECHLLLLRLAVAVPYDIVVLLLDLVQLNLKLDNLQGNTHDP